MAPDSVKNCHFSVVSCLAHKVLNLESQSFTGMLVDICSCASGVLRLESFSHVLVMTPDLVKN